MKKQTAIFAAIALAIVWGACSQGEQKVSLRFSYQLGTHLYYEQISKRNYRVIEKDSLISQNLMVDTMNIELEAIGMADDTTFEVMERGSLKRSVPSKEDSTRMEIVTLTTETLLHTLPNGKILSFEMLENEFPRTPGYLKNFYEQATPVFPSGEKPVGYSWTQTTKVVLPEETVEASTAYTIKALVRHQGYDCVLIEYNGNMILPITPNPQDSIPRSGVDRVNIKGLMYFAHQTGRVIEQTENWTIDGTRQTTKAGAIFEFKVMQDYSVSYRLVDVETKS